MCWGVGEVRGDVGKGEGSEEMWGSVLGPHTLTHLPYSSPHILSLHANTFSYSPHTLSHTPPHTSFPTSPYIPTHSPYLFPQLPSPPLHPNTLPHSPNSLSHTSPHIFPHSFNCVTKLCDDVILINLTGKARKIFYDNWEFKVLFRCRQCKFLMYESVAKLSRGKVTMVKLP